MRFTNTLETFIHLWAYFQHFWIHKRKSDYSDKQIISVFSDKCPYPVWHIDEWIKNSNPKSTSYEKNLDFWDQIWNLFKVCPIPHNTWLWNENCEYTDDCWNSKNCYLCHSLGYSQDIAYCFRIIRNSDSMFCVFSFDLQKCIDVIYWFDCYNTKYWIDIKRCKNSYFLFDCEDCEDCFMCYNLRNKKYNIWNIQFSKEEYFEELKKYNFLSRNVYETLKSNFHKLIIEKAWWKNLHNNNIYNSIWDYLDNCKNSKNCFYLDNWEDCENWFRCFWIKTWKNIISVFEWEKVFNSTMVQGNCFNINYSFNITSSKNLEYCANCHNCDDCFLCSWLVWKKYFILNKEYSISDYEKLKQEIINDMKTKWVYWEFFPAYFSPSSYNESLSWIYYPLSISKQKKYWFNVFEQDIRNNIWLKHLKDLPDDISKIDNYDFKWWYFDEVYNRTFQVTDLDISFSKKLWVPLNDRFYIRRLKENFSWMYPSYELRETKCVKSWKPIKTNLPEKFDSRILSIEEYEKLIY